MANKRIILSGIAAGSTANLGNDITRILAPFITGDLNSGSGVLDLAAGHLAVVQSTPAAMTVDVGVGLVYLKDNAAAFQSKDLRIGIIETAQAGLAVAANATGADRIDAVPGKRR